MSENEEHRIFHQPRQTEPPQSLEIASTLQKALALHQQGHLAQAEALYRRILQQAPNDFDALHLLGVIASQRKDFAASETQCLKAIEKEMLASPDPQISLA